MKLRTVKPTQGLVWVKQGLEICRRYPFNFIGLMGLFVSAALLLMGIPILGPLVIVGCMPLMWLAFMLATTKTLRGERPSPGLLFQALKGPNSPKRTLAQLAGAYVLATLLVMQLAHLLGPDSEQMSAVFKDAAHIGEIVEHPLFQRDMLTRALLTIPVALLFWHAPALILWHKMSMSKALFASFLACWRNLAAYVLYALGWFGVLVALVCIDRLVFSLIPVPILRSVLTIACGMWVASAFYASLYFTVKDSFDDAIPEVDVPPASAD